MDNSKEDSQSLYMRVLRSLRIKQETDTLSISDHKVCLWTFDRVVRIQSCKGVKSKYDSES